MVKIIHTNVTRAERAAEYEGPDTVRDHVIDATLETTDSEVIDIEATSEATDREVITVEATPELPRGAVVPFASVLRRLNFADG